MRRQGFTLVEMMVSLALVLFIMVILTQAFQAGLESFRLLKGVGDMEDNLRSVATILRRDLAADHFEGKRRISDESFWTLGPPREGYFRIWHGSPYAASPAAANVVEAATLQNHLQFPGAALDPDNIGASRATDHMLQFTVKLRGNQPQDFVSYTLPFTSALLSVPTNFAAPAPDARYQTGTEYSSQWFEVMYCLRQTGTTVLPDNPSGGPGTPLFALVRRQLVVVPDNSRLNWLSQPGSKQVRVYTADDVRQYAGMSCRKTLVGLTPSPNLFPASGDHLYFNNPTDLTVPARRFGMIPLLSSNQLTGQRERAGLPSVPLIDPNNLNAGAIVNTQRKCPMLGEMTYQTQKLGNAPPGQWPGWLKNWLGVNLPPSFLAHLPNGGQGQSQAQPLPVVWNDNPVLQGADVLLTDVVSFEVKVLLPGATAATDLFDAQQVPARNSVFQGAGPRVFDTWSSVKDDTYDYSNWFAANSPGSAPAPIRIMALQITLRVWDRRTQQTRQMTLVQPM